MEGLFSNPGLDLVTDNILEHLSCQELAALELSSPDIARYFVRRHVWNKQWIKISDENLGCRCTEDEKIFVNLDNNAESNDFAKSRHYRSLCYRYLCDLPSRWREGAPQIGYTNRKTGGILTEAALLGTNRVALAYGGYFTIAEIADGIKPICERCVKGVAMTDMPYTVQLPHCRVTSKKVSALDTHHDVMLVGDGEGALTWWHVDMEEWSELWSFNVTHSDNFRAVALSGKISLSMCHLRTIKVWKMHWQGKKNLSNVSLMQTLDECSFSNICRIRCTDDHIISGEGSALRVWKRTDKTTIPDEEDDSLFKSQFFLNAGNGNNLKDFIILDKYGKFLAACDFKGGVYAWDTANKLKKLVGTFDCYVNLSSNPYFLLVSTSSKISIYPIESVTWDFAHISKNDLEKSTSATSLRLFSKSQRDKSLSPIREIFLEELLNSTLLFGRQHQVHRMLSTPSLILMCCTEDIFSMSFSSLKQSQEMKKAEKKTLFKIVGHFFCGVIMTETPYFLVVGHRDGINFYDKASMFDGSVEIPINSHLLSTQDHLLMYSYSLYRFVYLEF